MPRPDFQPVLTRGGLVRTRHDWRRHAIIIALLAGLVAVVFAPSLQGQFLNWDDDRNFTENADYRRGGLAQARWAWQTYHLGAWQPLSWLLLGLQYRIGETLFGDGLRPDVYRGTSLALHIVNTIVFYFLALALVRAAGVRTTTELWRSIGAGLAAAIFALHPLRVEVVAWTSCQPYLPAALFFMLSILAYLRYAAACSRAKRWSWWLLTFTAYLFAILSKATAVSLPLVLLVLDGYPLQRGSSRPRGRGLARLLIEKVPFLLVAWFVSRWAAAAKDYSETRAPFELAGLGSRLVQAVYALVFYLAKIFAPLGLSPYYRAPQHAEDLLGGFLPAALVVTVITLAVVLLRRRPAWATAWAGYVLILLPNLGIVQISQQLAADRYSYLAAMPLMVLLAGWLTSVFSSRPEDKQLLHKAAGKASPPPAGWSRHYPRLLLPLLAGVVLFLSKATRHYLPVWHDSLSLWSRVLEGDPQCAVAECNLGMAHLERGNAREAARHVSRAIDLDQDFAWAYAELGVVFLEAEQYEDAVTALEHALTVKPTLPDRDRAKVHAAAGQAYANLRRYDLARRHTEEALRLGFAPARKMLEVLDRLAPGR